LRRNRRILLSTLTLLLYIVTISNSFAQNIVDLNNRTLKLFTEGDLKSALSSAHDAVEAARANGTVDPALATALANYAELLRRDSRYDDSSHLFDEALRTYNTLNDTTSEGYASTLNNFGLLALNQSMYGQAADRFVAAISARSQSHSGDLMAIAITYNNLGDAEAGLGKRSEAIRHYSKANELGLATTSVGIYADLQIGQLEGDLSHFPESEVAYTAAIQSALKAKPPDYVTAAQAQLSIVINERLLRNNQKAEAGVRTASEYLALASGPQTALAVSILLQKGSVLRELRRFDEARSALSQAMTLLDPRDDKDLLQKADIENSAAIVEVRQGRYAEAEPIFRRALDKLHKAGGDNNYTAASISTNLGFILSDSGRIQDANDLFETALHIFNRNHNQTDPNYAALLSNLSGNYVLMGRFEDAEPLLLQGAELDKRIYSDESIQYAINLNNLGDFYNQKSRWIDTLGVEKTAIGILEKKKEITPSLANAFHRLGIAELNLNASAEALLHLERAKSIAEGLGNSGTMMLAGTLIDLASAYDLAGNDTKAIETYKRSIDINTNLFGSDSPPVAGAYFGTGLLYLARKDYLRASKYFEDGNKIVVDRLSKDWSLAGLDVSGVRYRPFNSENGFIWQIQANSKIPVADAGAKDERADKLFQAAQWAEIADSAYSIGSMAARGTLDGNLSNQIRKRQDLALGIGRLEKSLVGKYASSASQEVPVLQDIAIAQEKLQTLKKQANELDLELKATQAKFMDAANPSPLSISDVQKYLRDDEALVDFLPTPPTRSLAGETFIWVITKSSVHLLTSPIDRITLVKFVKTLRCGLDRSLWDRLDTECANLTQASLDEGAPLPFRMDFAYALYYQLFSRSESDIAKKKLLIVTPRLLATLPLEVLPTAWPDFKTQPFAKDYTQVDWLIKEHQISVLPAVSNLRLLRGLKRSPLTSLPFVGFGDPSLKGSDTCIKDVGASSCPTAGESTAVLHARSAERRGGSLKGVLKDGSSQTAVLANVERLCPLPDSGVELNCIARAIGGTVYTRNNFTKAKLQEIDRSGELSEYRIVHFATHGLLPREGEDAAGEPSLVTTPSNGDDGLLKASDIMKLRLNADWVVLAACNTGSGAGGLKGLADAFFYAGARAILVSNWETNSRATVLLNLALAQAIKDYPGISLPEAHQTALLSLIRDSRNVLFTQPEYWAPFTVIGGLGDPNSR
jgi:CHAT domain-containing protein/tetratricopeptide (TPR) repeat protein